MGNYQQCPGHYGAIRVTPMLNHTYASYVASILNCICLKCNRIIFLASYLKIAYYIDPTKVNQLTIERRMQILKLLNRLAKRIGKVLDVVVSVLYPDTVFPLFDAKNIEF